MGKTLYDKLWDSHVIQVEADGTTLLYVDRQLLHEIASAQAFEGLRQSGRPIWRKSANLAVCDHNVPTTNRKNGIADPVSKLQVDTLDANCDANGIAEFKMKDRSHSSARHRSLCGQGPARRSRRRCLGVKPGTLIRPRPDPGRAPQRRAYLLLWAAPSDVYCCGPRPLMQAVCDVTKHWPSASVHCEDFRHERSAGRRSQWGVSRQAGEGRPDHRSAGRHKRSRGPASARGLGAELLRKRYLPPCAV
jgi:Aconitase family (aconitate hydratase)